MLLSDPWPGFQASRGFVSDSWAFLFRDWQRTAKVNTHSDAKNETKRASWQDTKRSRLESRPNNHNNIKIELCMLLSVNKLTKWTFFRSIHNTPKNVTNCTTWPRTVVANSIFPFTAKSVKFYSQVEPYKAKIYQKPTSYEKSCTLEDQIRKSGTFITTRAPNVAVFEVMRP